MQSEKRDKQDATREAQFSQVTKRGDRIGILKRKLEEVRFDLKLEARKKDVIDIDAPVQELEREVFHKAKRKRYTPKRCVKNED